MASTRPDSFEVADYLGVLRRRWWIVLLLVIVGAGAGAAYAKVAPKVYSAAVLVEVAPLTSNANAVQGRTGGAVNMDNEAQIVESVTVARLAGKDLHSTLTAAGLAKEISVSVPPNTTFLQIKCGTSTPSGAAACANAFGRAYLTNRRTTAANGISSELAAQGKRISALGSKVASLKTKVASLPNDSAERIRDQLSLSATQQLLAEVQGDSIKLVPLLDNLNLPNNTSVGQIVTPAATPTSPSSPRALLLLPSGVLAGLLLGLLAAFFIDFRDRRIHAARDVERFLDLPVLVNMTSGRSRMQPALVSPRTKAGQAFTELGQYVAASLGEGSHVIFVAGTSAGPGSSVLAANLAATLARTRSDVMLVCADPHGTVTPQLLEVSDGRGLAEVLAGTATVSEVARRPAGERRLRVITPGLDPFGGLLSLPYEATRRLLSELRHDCRYVIVEVQSVGEDSSAFALAEFADAAIMAVEISQTTRSSAADCLQRLDRLRTSVLGAVVLPATSGKAASRLPAPRPADQAAARPPAPGEERRRPAPAADNGRGSPRGSRAPGPLADGGVASSGGSRTGTGERTSGDGRTSTPPARVLNETRPMPRLPADPPARRDELADFPTPADQAAYPDPDPADKITRG